MARGDRESRRAGRARTAMEQQEFNRRMADASQSWLNAAQARYLRNVDGRIQIDSHNLSMAERTAKIAVDKIKLAMAIEEHKIEIVDKKIAAGIRGEKLINMRKARREFIGALRSAKVAVMGANRLSQRMETWTTHMEDLVFTARIKKSEVSPAWRGLFCIIDRLDRASKRDINMLAYDDADLYTANYKKPGEPDYIIPLFDRSSPALLYLLDWCKELGLVPADHSPLQQRLYHLMETVDVALAKQGAAHQVAADEAKIKLEQLRAGYWDSHDVV